VDIPRFDMLVQDVEDSLGRMKILTIRSVTASGTNIGLFNPSQPNCVFQPNAIIL
jgi:hypothetical protein